LADAGRALGARRLAVEGDTLLTHGRLVAPYS
jgi:hypothetical protein